MHYKLGVFHANHIRGSFIMFVESGCISTNTDYNLNPHLNISVGFLLTGGRNSKGCYVCSGVC